MPDIDETKECPGPSTEQSEESPKNLLKGIEESPKKSTREIEESPKKSTREIEESTRKPEESEELTPAPAMTTCKRCGERMPQTSMLTHYSQKHPEERLNAYQRLLGAPRGKQRLG